MKRESFDNYLEPPPRLVPAAEALPHLGGLILEAYLGELPDETESFAVGVLEDAFDDAAAQEILKRAAGFTKTRARLNRSRTALIGVSRRGEIAKGERRTYVIVAYDYAENVALEITLDEHHEFIGLSEERYQPPLIQAEIDRAVEMARADARLADRVDGLVAMAIPYAGADNEWRERRVIEVLFGCREDRLPRYRARVDLGSESVLSAGDVRKCCDQPEEAQS